MTNAETIGPYTVLEKLGQGGMGVVFKARDERLRRLVALKFLTEGAGDSRVTGRFLREAQAASALNHPNIITIYDIGEHNKSAYIVMEYVAGQSLRQALPPQGLPMATALDYAIQTAEGVAAAHAAGIVHRDLKPANVIVTPRGQIKVLDFGLARFNTGQGAGPTPGDDATAPGIFVGTAAYVAPEQSTGGDVDHRADIFSFGVMLHELLTGRKPFEGANVIELLYAINTGAPVKIRDVRPDLPATLESAVLRMLARNRDQRFQTMENVIVALQAIRSGAPVAAAEEPTRFAAVFDPEKSSAAATLSGPPAPGSEKASIAVLLFRSLSGDKEDEYLAAGIASEVVRALSGVPGVRVASELTSSRFRTEVSDLAELARSLGLRYVLTGSLRRAGNRIRVIAELSDAPNATMIWSQTYDRGIEDVFAVQEDIANAIVGATGGQILKSRSEQASREAPENLDAWGLVNKANHVVNHAYHFAAIDDAIELLRKAIGIAPEYAGAHSFLGVYLIQRVINSHSPDPAKDREEALAAIGQALRLAPADPGVLENSGLVHFNCGKADQARRALRRAVEITPFNLVAWGYLGLCLGWAGNAREIVEARTILDRLIHNTPDHPSLPYWLYFKAGVCARQGDYEEAADCAQRSAEMQPRFTLALLEYANALGCLGRLDEAAEVAREAHALNPGGTEESYLNELLIATGSAERAQPHLAGLARLSSAGK